MVNDPDTWFAGLSPGIGPPPVVFGEVRIDALRLLPDGRVVALELNPFVVPPPGSPTTSIGIEGSAVVYERTPDGWRIAFGFGGALFRVRVEDPSDAGTPDSAATAPTAGWVRELT